MATESSLLNQCLEFAKAFLDEDRRFSFSVQTSDGFNFTFNNGIGNPNTVGKKKSPSQLRRDQLRIGKFIQKKKETGTPDTVEKLTRDDIFDDVVSKSEVQYVTGEWHKAPEDSKDFATLFKPTFVGVERIVNFQEGIPTEAQRKENVTPFMTTLKMKNGVKINFLTKLENWPDGVNNVKVNLRASLK